MRLRLLLDQIVLHLLEEEMEAEKVARYLQGQPPTEQRAIVAALSHLLRSAARSGVKHEVAALELQQLGLPKTHANALGRLLAKERARLQAHFARQALRLSRLKAVQWRTDFVLASSSLMEVAAPQLQVAVTLEAPSGPLTTTAFACSDPQARLLLHELRQARALMETL